MRHFAGFRISTTHAFDVTGRHFIPDGESFHIKQMALSERARPGEQACVRMRAAAHPSADLVICTLRPGCEQVVLDLVLTQGDEAVFVVSGAPVDVSRQGRKPRPLSSQVAAPSLLTLTRPASDSCEAGHWLLLPER